MFTHLNQRERFTEDEARIYIAEVTLALEHLHNVSQCSIYKHVIRHNYYHDVIRITCTIAWRLLSNYTPPLWAIKVELIRNGL